MHLQVTVQCIAQTNNLVFNLVLSVYFFSLKAMSHIDCNYMI